MYPTATMAWLGGGRPLYLEDFRQYQENERQWMARREFLGRHMHLYPGHKIDELIALSMVWSNIVFIGNRYGELLTQKVYQMGEGIDIGEMPSYELVPGAMKRPSLSNVDEQPLKKKFGPRPRFEPLHFVSSTVEEDKRFLGPEKNMDMDRQEPYHTFQTPDIQPETSDLCFPPNDCMDADDYTEMEMELDSCHIFDPNAADENKKNNFDHFLKEMQQSYSAKFESHYSSLGKDFRSKILDSWEDLNKQGRKGIGFVKPPKLAARAGNDKQRFMHTSVGRKSNPLNNLSFIKQLSSIVKGNIIGARTSRKPINYAFMLCRSVQACKTNPEYIYSTVQDPLLEGYGKRRINRGILVCEVRCQDIYLATGYSWTKNKARDHAAKLAIQLLEASSLDVTTVKRKWGQGYRDDLVAFSTDVGLNDIPPYIKQETTSTNNDDLPDQQFPEEGKGTSKPLSAFIVIDSTTNAISALQSSSERCKMAVDYRYDVMPNNAWRCCVYVEDHYIAEGFGSKKNSKRIAAEAAVKILKNTQPIKSEDLSDTPITSSDYPSSDFNNIMINHNMADHISGPPRSLKDIVLYENASDPISTLNDTAQLNQIIIGYEFEKAGGMNWKCKVFIEQQFIAEAVGVKKYVKHEAAEAAVNVLRKTQPVVINNLKKMPVESVISRQNIRGLLNDEASKQQIKEDNIGNRLLRKMGWTGGGLGKEGEGIAEPIKVKEQFNREGLGLVTTNQKITKKNIEPIIRNFASTYTRDDLTFSRELTNEERKEIHQMAQKYGLKSKSYGQGTERFLVVSRKISKQALLDRLKEEGQFGSYALVMPHN